MTESKKFISQFLPDKIPDRPERIRLIDRWILTKYSKLVRRCTELMDNFNFSQTMKEVEYFLWHELADHYIEMVKNLLYQGKYKDSITYTLYHLGLGIAKMFAPFFPHITEEIYHRYYKDKEGKESIHISDWPTEIMIDEKAEVDGELVKNVIASLRRWKGEKGIALNAPMENVKIFSNRLDILEACKEDIKATLNIKNLEISSDVAKIERKVVSLKPVYASIGKKYREKAKEIYRLLKEIDPNEIYMRIEKEGKTSIEGFEISKEDLKFEFSYSIQGEKVDIISVDDNIIAVPVKEK